MQVPEVTPEEAKRLLDGGEGYVYLDVRTEAEFLSGRTPGAMNIPVAVVNATTGQMEFNARFMETVQAALPVDARIIVGCKAGPRSESACGLMIQAGYTNVSNMVGGFSGMTDHTGQVMVEGWSTLGYPIERGPISTPS